MNVGETIRIEGTNTAFDGKEGIIEDLDENGNCTVFVNFIPDENKKIRQNFDLNNIFPITQENTLSEGKKSNTSQISNLKKENDYNISSLTPLDVAYKDDMELLCNFPYAFNVYVSNVYLNSYNDLRDTILKSKNNVINFLVRFNRCFLNLDDIGNFRSNAVEKVNGLPKKYDGKIKELKVCLIDGKPIRILYFTAPNKTIVLGNIFYHKSSSLTTKERMSCNDTYDKVFPNKN